MADLLVSALIPTVLKKAADSLVQRLGEMWGINDQRERLHNMLLEIHAVLPDAEDKANSNAAIKSWLQNLKSAAYDAGDLLDQFCYEELRRDAVRRGHKVGNVSRFFSLENPALFRYKMSGKLKKLVGRIDGLVVQMGRFGFQQGQRVQLANRVKTDANVIESKVVGRDEDQEKIVKLLLEESNNEGLKVVPVVGMGGLGKTTIAQLVYKDPRVNDHFKLPLWVCVSEDYNIGLLLKSIIELVMGKCEVPIDNMELLRRRLNEAIGGKRYFLVLDDVWNDNVDEWDRLKALLNCGDSGSAIIVTTRSDRVASIMGTVESYKLGFLDEDDSWKLFYRRAFSMGVQENGELVDIGKKMVQNCGGLPLAITTLGSLMSYKHEVREWSAALEESKFWEIRSNNNNVLRVLRLSYDNLPPYMKQCFAFCAVFPKDFEMDKEKLIQYWMASGFIPSDSPGSPEMKGGEIFDELAWRSFFHEVKVNRLKRSARCKMHDLMHDLAQSIMGDECLSLLELPTQINQSKLIVRHISYKKFPSDINNISNSFPTIRSLISTAGYQYASNVGFLKANALQILELHAITIGRTMVTPEKMKYLRYLEISGNFASFPESITTLYLLQTLRLGTCGSLVKLPNGMKYMSSLRHIYIEDEDDDFRLRSMPPCLGQLNCLQVLTMYIVGTSVGNCIAELRNLNLHGTLHLYNIREVRDAVNAMEANLIAKQNLDDLALCWGMPAYYKSSNEVPEFNDQEVVHCDPREVLDALKPCNNIKVLEVTQYPGNEFPVWITEYSVLKNLIELYIIGCKKCTKIPPLDKLPYLRILHLQFFDKLRHLCSSDSTSGERDEEVQVAFPALKKLVLFEMPILSSWCEGEVGNETLLDFPVLKSLDIINCPKLTAMPSAPLLEKLSVKGNRTLQCIATRLTELQKLSLDRNGGDIENANESLSFQPWESLNDLSLTGYNSIVPLGTKEAEEPSVTETKCRYLNLDSCNFIFSSNIVVPNSSLWFWKCFTCLQSLTIWTCENMKYWPEKEFRSLNCLTYIWVDDCPNFLGSQQDLQSSERAITEALLPKLEEMKIWNCPDMIEIPKCSMSIKILSISGSKRLERLPEWLESMVSLKELEIRHCDNLRSLPSSLGGLTNLEKLQIFYCENFANFPEGMEGLITLEVLKIKNCSKIRVLPGGLLQRLKNLDQLWIEECPHLERHFKRFGKYRRLTSEIRIAKIGGDPVWG
ncbi:NBS-LRR-like resistance protein [Rhynchospora pubera]|uniref:NBS-LRR-like resistance protein n=1 Tax=Rhynchospora pubera TaxID=906938 RepID=A0AAV8E6J1_9POAL|nr:NBS-LRR-like resistance protein [Rhynchospora pubera]